MTSRPLDLEIRRNGRHEDYITADADPANPAALREILQGWLTGHKWSRGRWPEFDMLVRYAGENKVRLKVRAR